MPFTSDQFVTWANANEGVVSIILFVIALILGWTSGIFSALRRKPKFRIRTIEGPTFFTTFGTGEKHGAYDVHRTGIALYLAIANVGASPASIDAINVGYRWAIGVLRPLWWRYGLHRFWLYNQSIILSDFQVALGNDTKYYPFLVQHSSLSGSSAETFLEIGRSTNGVVYFEQNDSFGACFPRARKSKAVVRVVITDSFGQKHSQRLSIPRVTLEDARKFNPSFGLTFNRLRQEIEPIDLPVDTDGNILPPNDP